MVTPKKAESGKIHNPASKFERLSIPEPNSGCWLWMGAPTSVGYGVMQINRKKISAHRYAYELHIGPIPHGKWILHRCDNRLCVNPEHLYPGTSDDNIADKMRRLRHTYGQNHPFAKLSEKDALAIKLLPGTHQEIANLYRVHRVTITDIKSGRNWRYLNDENASSATK